MKEKEQDENEKIMSVETEIGPDTEDKTDVETEKEESSKTETDR